MKKVIATIVVLALPCLLLAQDISKSFDIRSIQKVSIDFDHSDIIIVPSDVDQITISGDIIINGDHMPERINIQSNTKNGILNISGEIDIDDVDHVMTIVDADGNKTVKKVSKKEKYNYRNYTDDGKVVSMGVNVDATLTIMIPRKLNILTHTLYGSTVINGYSDGMHITSTYGTVEATMDRSKSLDMKLHSTYGAVDLSLLDRTDVDITLDTDYGQIYTDMDINPLKNRASKINEYGEYIQATLNKGGGSVVLKADYGNIYLRKSK